RGRWRSDRSELIARCSRPGSLGRALVQRLAPADEDYFIFKPKHSGFFATPLAALLEHLGTRTLVLTGVTTEQCVLFTAIDAYVRDYEIVVPRDCVAGLKHSNVTLKFIGDTLKAKTGASSRLHLPKRSSVGNRCQSARRNRATGQHVWLRKRPLEVLWSAVPSKKFGARWTLHATPRETAPWTTAISRRSKRSSHRWKPS